MSLDPKTNRREREAEKVEENQAPPLNPPFPYRRQAFDPFNFGFERETLGEKAERNATD